MRLIDADALIRRHSKRKTIPISSINEASTISPTRHGKWLDVYTSGPLSFVGTCSVCRALNDIPPPVSANYCPNCGAKMDLD